jgi:sugar lactone lactonase YvrE
MTAAARAEVVAGPAELAEGPLWDDRAGVVRWVDLEAGIVRRLEPGTGEETAVRLDVPVGAIALRADGGLVVAAGLGLAAYDEETESLLWLARVDRGRRVNDAKPDPAGRMLLGTLVPESQPGAAALYRIEPDVVTVLCDATISNGLGWSPDGRLLYYVDTPLRRIDVFDYDVATGDATGRRTFVDLAGADGRPDGLTVDADGGVWVAISRGGAAVRRFLPDGSPDLVVDLPVPNVTSVTFGGPDLDDLYVTTARIGDNPLAGCLFRVASVGVRGLPADRYAG